MSYKYNKKLIPNAQSLRKDMTKEENKLWYKFLKVLPLTVNRQKVIGNYIVDFYCAANKTVIELDGSQHYEKDNVGYKKGRIFKRFGDNCFKIQQSRNQSKFCKCMQRYLKAF